VGDEPTADDGNAAALFVHLVVFVSVNLLLVAIWALFIGGAPVRDVPDLITHPARAQQVAFFPVYVLYGWGSGLVIHAAIYLTGIPGRHRRRRARARERRRRQAQIVGALGSTVLADAAVAGIRLVEGDRAADGVARRVAARRTVRQTGRPWAARRVRTPAEPRRRDGDQGATRRWVAVMFTDIADSTPLNQHFGDEVWADLLAEHRATVRTSLRRHRGSEVGTQGDSFLLRFESPDDAADCAIDLQKRFDAERARGESSLHVRIGLHAGEVVENQDDLVGRVINLAARVTSAAAADEILVTEPFADHLTNGHRLADRGLETLKGFDRPRHLLALAWQAADP
jgi:class 3 adenylate cyclase